MQHLQKALDNPGGLLQRWEERQHPISLTAVNAPVGFGEVYQSGTGEGPARRGTCWANELGRDGARERDTTW